MKMIIKVGGCGSDDDNDDDDEDDDVLIKLF
jgi:hypothetical protein